MIFRRGDHSMEGKMSKVFVQVLGEGAGAEVEVIHEDAKGLILRNLRNNFEYGISLRAFEQGYKVKEGVKDA
jgi:signal transduction histidine kinase